MKSDVSISSDELINGSKELKENQDVMSLFVSFKNTHMCSCEFSLSLFFNHCLRILEMIISKISVELFPADHN